MGDTPVVFTYKSNRFDELKAEGRTSPDNPSEMERTAALLLRSKAIRSLAIAVKASGGLLIRDLAKQLPPEEKDHGIELTAQLKSNYLVDSEIVVVWVKSQAQVARVPTTAVIEEMARLGMKCACGRSIRDEKIEEALTITDLGRGLLDKARWLTILLVDHLQDSGVPAEAILVEQSVGGDEIDCLANISGELVLFELKDKEFSLGNAYSFGAKRDH